MVSALGTPVQVKMQSYLSTLLTIKTISHQPSGELSSNVYFMIKNENYTLENTWKEKCVTK